LDQAAVVEFQGTYGTANEGVYAGADA